MVPIIPRVSTRPLPVSNTPPSSVHLVREEDYDFESRTYRRLLGAIGALVVSVVGSPGGDVRFRLKRNSRSAPSSTDQHLVKSQAAPDMQTLTSRWTILKAWTNDNHRGQLAMDNGKRLRGRDVSMLMREIPFKFDGQCRKEPRPTCHLTAPNQRAGTDRPCLLHSFVLSPSATRLLSLLRVSCFTKHILQKTQQYWGG